MQPVLLADVQQGLAKRGHGAGVVFTLIMDGVEAVQGDDLDCVFYLAITACFDSSVVANRKFVRCRVTRQVESSRPASLSLPKGLTPI